MEKRKERLVVFWVFFAVTVTDEESIRPKMHPTIHPIGASKNSVSFYLQTAPPFFFGTDFPFPPQTLVSERLTPDRSWSLSSPPSAPDISSDFQRTSLYVAVEILKKTRDSDLIGFNLE